MEVELVAISQIATEVISRKQIDLAANPLITIEEIYAKIYEHFRHLQSEDCSLYWHYSPTRFYKITDFFSYRGCLESTGEPKKIYILVKDSIQPWKDNCELIQAISYINLKQRLEQERDIYDVKIKPDFYDGEEEQLLQDADDYESEVAREEYEIIQYALHISPLDDCNGYTADIAQYNSFIEDVKKGIPKDKKVLVRPKEEVIDRPGLGEKKRKGDKKKSSKKGSKKGSSKGSEKKSRGKGKKK